MYQLESKNMTRKAIINILLLSILIACSGVKEFFHPEPDRIIPGEINPGLLADGTYTGEATCGPVLVKLDVELEDHAITGIRILKHRTGQGQTAESIIDTVIRAQSLRVDVISGATISSKTILLAIETALDPASDDDQ